MGDKPISFRDAMVISFLPQMFGMKRNWKNYLIVSIQIVP